MPYLIVLLSVLSRFLPHPWNFSPVFGALLFGGAHLKKRDSIWFPVALLAASDFVLTTQVYGMKMHWSHALVWVGYAVLALIGWWLRRRISIRRFTAAALAEPTAFYLISNFGVWLGFGTYPPTWEGLVACYVAALPFYRNSLVASFLFGGFLFGVYEMYRRKVERPTTNSSIIAHGA
ncbi:MAG: hypothetical protein L0099_09450 [Acidobacteria bacterium]|nr:hypothetical protein [Acidobacteriota bacterium]